MSLSRSSSPPSPFSSKQRRHHALDLLYPSPDARNYAMPTVVLISQSSSIASVTASSSISLPFHTVNHFSRLVVSRKIHRGFQTYQKNTGAIHPMASKLKLSEPEKRSTTGSEPLVDMEYYSTIHVGTPPKAFKGKLLFFES